MDFIQSITVSSHVKFYYHVNYRQSEFIQDIKNKLTFLNPKYVSLIKSGRKSYFSNIPKHVFHFKETQIGETIELSVPKGGCFNWVCQKFEARKIIKLQIPTAKALPILYRFPKQLKDYQYDAVVSIIKERYCCIEVPTGGGKTVIALFAMFLRKMKTLVVVHTKELLNQWVNRIHENFGIKKRDIGTYGGGRKKIRPITVAIINSIKTTDLSLHFDFLVVDECHHVPANMFTTMMNNNNFAYHLGLSATFKRNDDMQKLITAYMGQMAYRISHQNLVARGDILPYRVKMIGTNYTFTNTCLISEMNGAEVYREKIKDMIANGERTKLISQYALKYIFEDNKNYALILTDRIDHAYDFYKYLSNKADCRLLTGGVKQKERNKIVAELNQGKFRILISISKIIGEGFDSSLLSGLFLAYPFKYDAALIQFIGRILRIKENSAVVYDFVDQDFIKAARSRLDTYKRYTNDITIKD